MSIEPTEYAQAEPGGQRHRCSFFNPYRADKVGQWIHPDAYYVTVEGQSAWGCPHCHQLVEQPGSGKVAQSRCSVLSPLGKHQLARYSRYRLACAAVVTFSAAFLIYGLQEKNQVWYAWVGIACLIIAMPFLVSVIMILEEQISSAYETRRGAASIKWQMALGGVLNWLGLTLIFWSYSHLFALIFFIFSLFGLRQVWVTGTEEMAARVVLHHKMHNRENREPEA